MTTNRDRLNEGPPAFDPAIPPEDLPTADQVNWGRAFQALFGTKDTAENQLGTALLRAPVLLTAVAVAAHTATLATAGAITAVRASAGGATGGKRLIPDGTPAAGEVRVTYDVDLLPTLLFAAADAVTQCSLTQMQIPAAFVAMMAAANPA